MRQNFVSGSGLGAERKAMAERFDAVVLGLMANRDRRVLVGAWAVAPQAGEWIHQASQAIRAEISIEKLRDMVAQFPTYSEAYLNALEQLDI